MVVSIVYPKITQIPLARTHSTTWPDTIKKRAKLVEKKERGCSPQLNALNLILMTVCILIFNIMCESNMKNANPISPTRVKRAGRPDGPEVPEPSKTQQAVTSLLCTDLL